MQRRFLRTLAVIAIVQFVITRQAAGRTTEEGRAERMWMFYPVNVVMNAAAWTLLLAFASVTARIIRRAP